MTVRDALNLAMDEEMARDPKIFLMGKILLFDDYCRRRSW